MKIQYKWNPLIFSVLLVCFILAGLVYFFNYDIVINEGQGSLKSATGFMFLIPLVILPLVQLLIAGGILHLVTIIRSKKKRDCLKAFTIASVLILLFSLTYQIFPTIGPFYYMIFPVTTGPSVLLAEILITVLTIAVVSILIRKSYKFSWKLSLLSAAFLLALIMAIAS